MCIFFDTYNNIASILSTSKTSLIIINYYFTEDVTIYKIYRTVKLLYIYIIISLSPKIVLNNNTNSLILTIKKSLSRYVTRPAKAGHVGTNYTLSP